MNRSMPPGVIIPELAYPDVREAVDWLCRAFGFTERLRIGSHRSQLTFGEGSLIVMELPVELENGFRDAVMVRVADAETHYENARKNGAKIISPPTDYPYGERQYTVQDIGGHIWTFSQSIEDVDPSAWGGTHFHAT